MTTFVLIPGAWHGAWCWERVTPLLEAGGHRVIAPELIGMGADRARAAQGGLAAWAEQVAGIVAAAGEPVVLCGHSRGGAVISLVAERVPERIAALVYITALLVPDGKAIRDLMAQFADPSAMPAEKLPDGTSRLAPEAVIAAAYNTTPPDLAARAASLVSPEPRGTMATPLAVSTERFGRVRRAYVECLQDRVLPIAGQRSMQAKLPCDPVITLDCDHSPFYSAPEKLAAALVAVG